MKAQHKSIRFTDEQIRRIGDLARTFGITFSAAARIVIVRGLAVLETQTNAAPTTAPPRRRILSPGVE